MLDDVGCQFTDHERIVGDHVLRGSMSAQGVADELSSGASTRRHSLEGLLHTVDRVGVHLQQWESDVVKKYGTWAIRARRGAVRSSKQHKRHITASLIPRAAAVETSAMRFHHAAALGTKFLHVLQGANRTETRLAADIRTFPPSADPVPSLIGYAVVAVDGRIGRMDEHSLRADVYKPIEHCSASGRYNNFYGNS